MHTPAMPSPDMNGALDAGGDIGAGDIGGGFGGEEKWQERAQKSLPIALPEDLPRCLEDRRPMEGLFVPETEMYDAWQGV